jgi:hypothetical protein
MICYLRGANISEYNQELVRQDLTEMVLSAQRRGESIHAVIGEDFQVFCDNVIASLPQKSQRQRIVDFFDMICLSLSILGAIYIVFADETIALIRNAFIRNPLNFSISVSLGKVIFVGIIIIVAFVMVEGIMKKSFQVGKKEKQGHLKVFLMFAGLTALYLLIAWLGQTTLFTVNIFIACAVVLALYIAHKVLERV